MGFYHIHVYFCSAILGVQDGPDVFFPLFAERHEHPGSLTTAGGGRPFGFLHWAAGKVLEGAGQALHPFNWFQFLLDYLYTTANNGLGCHILRSFKLVLSVLTCNSQ